MILTCGGSVALCAEAAANGGAGWAAAADGLTLTKRGCMRMGWQAGNAPCTMQAQHVRVHAPVLPAE